MLIRWFSLYRISSSLERHFMASTGPVEVTVAEPRYCESQKRTYVHCLFSHTLSEGLDLLTHCPEFIYPDPWPRRISQSAPCIACHYIAPRLHTTKQSPAYSQS